MKMEMEIDAKTLMSEYDLYLFGTVVFLPEAIENKAMTAWQLRHYFPHKNTSGLETILNIYEKHEFLKLDKLKNQRYVLTDIDREAFQKVLEAHLDNTKLKSDTMKLLWDVCALQCKPENDYRAIIKWQDIYDYRPKCKYTEPFWEMIFTLAKRGWIKLEKIDYMKAAPVTIKNGVPEQINEQLLHQLERPVVEFKVIKKGLQRQLLKQKGAIKYKVGIILAKSGKLQVSLDGKRHTIVNYKSQKNNTFRVAQALYDANEAPLTRSGLNLKTDTKTDFRTLIKYTRITGILDELFLEYGVSQPLTVRLKHHAKVDLRQYEQLVEYVKTLDTKD